MPYQEALIVVFWANEMRKRPGGLTNEEMSLLNSAESAIESYRSNSNAMVGAKVSGLR